MIQTLSLLPALALASPVLLPQSLDPVRSEPSALVRTVETDATIASGRAIGGISVDARGRIYSATFHRRVYRIEQDGTVTVLNGSFRQASGNTIDNRGALLQSEYLFHELYRVHEDGSRTLITDEGLFGPVGVAMDANDDIFVVNYRGDTITRITPEGTSTRFSDDPLLNGPNGITIDDVGGMYVANFDDDLLLRIDESGAASVVASMGTNDSNAHVTSLGGKLYVSTIWTHEIYEVTTDGQVRLVVGRGFPGTRDGLAPHQAMLSHPNGIAAHPHGKYLYTNNYIGVMGTPGSPQVIREIEILPGGPHPATADRRTRRSTYPSPRSAR